MAPFSLQTVNPYNAFNSAALRIPEGGAIGQFLATPEDRYIAPEKLTPSCDVAQTFAAVGYGNFTVRPKSKASLTLLCAAGAGSIDITKATAPEAWKYFWANSLTMIGLNPVTLKLIVDRMSADQRKSLLEGTAPWRQLVRGGDRLSVINSDADHQRLFQSVRTAYGIANQVAQPQRSPTTTPSTGLVREEDLIESLCKPLRDLLACGYPQHSFHYNSKRDIVYINKVGAPRGITTTLRFAKAEHVITAVKVFLEHGATYIDVRMIDGAMSILGDFQDATAKASARRMAIDTVRGVTREPGLAQPAPVHTYTHVSAPDRQVVLKQMMRMRDIMASQLPLLNRRRGVELTLALSADGSVLTFRNMTEERRILALNPERIRNPRNHKFKILKIERVEARPFSGENATKLLGEVVSKLDRSPKIEIEINPIAASMNDAFIVVYYETKEVPM